MTLLSAPTAQAQGLGVGDKAPPLSVIEWVKGRPVDLKRDAAKKVHVVEFWATWCPPCKMSVPLLTSLQKKFSEDVVIVGITEPDMRGNSPAAIRDFVKTQGTKMDYTVAIDDGRTSQAYMAAAGVIGIPHAFIVNHDNMIVWQGSPLEPALEEVLGQVAAGKFDLKAAQLENEVNKRLQKLEAFSQMGQWGVVWEGLVDIMKLDPSNDFAMELLMRISIEQLDNLDEFRNWARSHVSAHKDNATAMHRLADILCSVGHLGSRFPDLALEAAKASYDASKQRDAAAISAYARALYQIGKLDRAIALQQDAVALADGDRRAETKDILAYYRHCKKLQESLE
jgi:thiol-disulfide isomerase/thioredoxin